MGLSISGHAKMSHWTVNMMICEETLTQMSHNINYALSAWATVKVWSKFHNKIISSKYELCNHIVVTYFSIKQNHKRKAASEQELSSYLSLTLTYLILQCTVALSALLELL